MTWSELLKSKCRQHLLHRLIFNKVETYRPTSADNKTMAYGKILAQIKSKDRQLMGCVSIYMTRDVNSLSD